MQVNNGESPELARLENQAIGIDAELDGDQAAQDNAAGEQEAQSSADFGAELADVLDMVALAGSGLLPTAPDHFNHAQNEKIAGALILLADKYDYDLRANFLSKDSTVMLWVGVVFAVGMPARACMIDYKRMKEKEVKDAPPDMAEAGHAAGNVDAERPVTVG